MCGIVGMMTSEKTIGQIGRRKWLTQALILDTLRGSDSTGLVAVRHEDDKSPLIIKDTLPGYTFVRTKPYENVVADMDEFKAFIGHNRAGTIGSKYEVNNAHPFNYGHIWMVHNGTLDLWKYMDDEKLCDTDSQAICYQLSLCHSDEEYKDVLEQLDGAYALVWYDTEQDCLYMARNDERPFHFAFSKDKRDVFFASEKEMLILLMKRNDYELDGNLVYKLSAGRMLKWEDTKSYTTIKFTPKPYTVWNNWPHYQGARSSHSSSGGSTRSGNLYEDTKKAAQEKKTTILNGESFHLLSRKEAKRKAKHHGLNSIRCKIRFIIDRMKYSSNPKPGKEVFFRGRMIKDINGVNKEIPVLGFMSGTTYTDGELNTIYEGRIDKGLLVSKESENRKDEFTIRLLPSSIVRKGMIDKSNVVPIDPGNEVGQEEEEDTAIEYYDDPCGMCNMPIPLHVLDTIRWTNGSFQPICEECDEVYYTPKTGKPKAEFKHNGLPDLCV